MERVLISCEPRGCVQAGCVTGCALPGCPLMDRVLISCEPRGCVQAGCVAGCALPDWVPRGCVPTAQPLDGPVRGVVARSLVTTAKAWGKSKPDWEDAVMLPVCHA